LDVSTRRKIADQRRKIYIFHLFSILTMSTSHPPATLIFAADAILRAHDGFAPFVAQSPQLIGWLAQFMRATDTERALHGLSLPDQDAARAVLVSLQNNGALVAANSPESALPSAAHAHARSCAHLNALARQMYDLSADVQGLGEYGETAMRATGAGLERRLLALGAAVNGLRRDLAALRAPYLTEQFAALEPAGGALALHIGCGPVHLAGFVNIDIAPAPLSMNVLWGLPFEDNSARVVYLSHLLEHLFYPIDVMALFAEIRRVLQPGGLVRIVVPDMAKCVKAYATGDSDFFAARRELFSWWPSDASALENFLTYAGVGPEPTTLFAAHKYGYDYATLSAALGRAGFEAIVQSQFQASQDPSLHIEHLSEAARWQAGGEYLSLFVEARKRCDNGALNKFEFQVLPRQNNVTAERP
jgi:SAM-dependent methyltransferase